MFDSLIVDVIIGIVFTFAITAALASGFTELYARYLGLRGDYLLRGLRALVDGDAVKAKAQVKDPSPDTPSLKDSDAPISSMLVRRPTINNLGTKTTFPLFAGGLSRKARRGLPSYLSSASFAAAVVDCVVPDSTGTTETDALMTKIKANIPDGVFQDSLVSLARTANNDITTFRTAVETWYDDHMDRVSGWYKRHTRWITLVIGAVLVVGLNINTLSIARSLYTDQALRQSVVTEAFKKAECGKPSKTPVKSCLDDARARIGKLRQDGLPIGWGTVAACAHGKCDSKWKNFGIVAPNAKGVWPNFKFTATVLLGLLLTILALVPGARFWFDALSRLGTLRSSGPKPKRTT